MEEEEQWEKRDLKESLQSHNKEHHCFPSRSVPHVYIVKRAFLAWEILYRIAIETAERQGKATDANNRLQV